MTMRLEVDFPRPLTLEQRTAFLLVVSALAKTKRIAFVRGHQGAVVAGEALSAMRLREVLTEEGIAVEAVRSSLAESGPGVVEEGTEAAKRERVRPIGR
jgi:hypothetical protein